MQSEYIYKKTGDPKKTSKHCCHICGRVCQSSKGLSQHQQVHQNGESLQCKICGTKYTQRSYLTRHMLTHGEKRFHCDICKKTFFQTTDLKMHMRVHTGERPHVCEVCSKRFRQSSHLISHMKVHTGQKGHSCVTCSKRFSSTVRLNAHIQYEHSGKNPRQCDLCGKMFHYPSDLKKHTRTHTTSRRQKVRSSSEEMQLLLKENMRQANGFNVDHDVLEAAIINLTPANGEEGPNGMFFYFY